MIVKHPRMIIKQHEYFINYRYVGDVSHISLVTDSSSEEDSETDD